MLSSIQDTISRRWFASPLAIWGKLPSHGDFLCHNTSPAQAQGWQDWAARVWSQRPAFSSKKSRQPRSASQTRWMALNPRKPQVNLAEVPVSFVMQAGAMPFAPRHCVQGVAVASSDEVGRPCPLVFFQLVTPYWLRRSWSNRTSAQSQDDMLYWLSRIAARTHAADQTWGALVQAVDTIWQMHKPHWRQWMGAPVPLPSGAQSDAVVRQFCAHDSADTALGLKGVRSMPWASWPAQIVRADQPTHAFWQQDMRGGYVSVSEHLPLLWGKSL